MNRDTHRQPASKNHSDWVINRRLFLKVGLPAAASMLAPVSALGSALFANSDQANAQATHKASTTGTLHPSGASHTRSGTGARQPVLRFGLVTDSHYADIDTRGTRYYRESISKMAECTGRLNREQVDFIMHLGDFKNGAPDNNLEHLALFESVYATFRGPRYHVLGNHDMDRLSKPLVQSVITNSGIARSRTWYSFVHSGVRLVVLDANFRTDATPYDSGNFDWTDTFIPDNQLQWLSEELRASAEPVIVFVHQLLDGDGQAHDVKNAAEVRQVLGSDGRVLAVFQGHQHSGQYNRIDGIHYVTLQAMVEGSGPANNAYSLAEVFDDGSIELTGFRRHTNLELHASGG